MAANKKGAGRTSDPFVFSPQYRTRLTAMEELEAARLKVTEGIFHTTNNDE